MNTSLSFIHGTGFDTQYNFKLESYFKFHLSKVGIGNSFSPPLRYMKKFQEIYIFCNSVLNMLNKRTFVNHVIYNMNIFVLKMND